MSQGIGDDPVSELAADAFEVLTALASIAESRDPYSEGHSQRVAFLARRLAFEMGLDSRDVLQIEMAARIHDVGKLSIRDEILLKQGPLSPTEWAEMMQHPRRGAEIVHPIRFFQELGPIIESHHEHYDGGGYPRGLEGEEIPLGARILAVADAYDALTSKRSYRPGFSHEDAVNVIRDGAGRQWAPEVVAAFTRLVETEGHMLMDLSSSIDKTGQMR